jgi:16S rRNA pseudouridine516 synthase
MGNRKVTLDALLAGQGFGTRKECRRLVRAGAVEIARAAAEGGLPEGPGDAAKNGPAEGPRGAAEPDWKIAEDADAELDPRGLHFRIAGLALPWRETLYLAFHKPPGTECSHAPSHHQSVFSFFPDAFMRRGLEAVGRLDADTTGLLLLTDSGAFNHSLTSPRKHVAKTYRVGVKHPISDEQVGKLTAGVELRGEDGMTLPARVERLSERTCDLTVEEGKYHQVKRMFAAAGNRVESIHRIAVGPVRLDGLAEGAWRWLTDAELAALGFGGP